MATQTIEKPKGGKVAPTKGTVESPEVKHFKELLGDKKVQMINRDKLVVIPTNNPRGVVNIEDKEHSDFLGSVREVGIIQPVLVKAIADGMFELMAGYRRCAAADKLHIKNIPCLVFESIDINAEHTVSLIENTARMSLNPIKEARRYTQLVDSFSKAGWENPVKRLAKITGVRESRVEKLLEILSAPQILQDKVEFENMPVDVVLAMTDKEGRYLSDSFIQEVIDMLPGKGERASVSETKAVINELIAAKLDAGITVGEGEGVDTAHEAKVDDSAKIIPLKKAEKVELMLDFAKKLEASLIKYAEGGKELDLEVNSAEFLYGVITAIGMVDGFVVNLADETIKADRRTFSMKRHTEGTLLTTIISQVKQSVTEEALAELVAKADSLVVDKKFYNMPLTKKVTLLYEAIDGAATVEATEEEEVEARKAEVRKQKDKSGK